LNFNKKHENFLLFVNYQQQLLIFFLIHMISILHQKSFLIKKKEISVSYTYLLIILKIFL